VRRTTCGIAAQIYSSGREILVIPETNPYLRLQVALHNGGFDMIALIEKFLDAMFAPLARELERMPPQAMRFNVFF
jgi:hypothetical protein